LDPGVLRRFDRRIFRFSERGARFWRAPRWPFLRLRFLHLIFPLPPSFFFFFWFFFFFLFAFFALARAAIFAFWNHGRHLFTGESKFRA
jgi:hypothetical protein